MNAIAAIIVTFNRKALLLQCVQRLLVQAGAAPDIWVIDNASTDGTFEALAAYRTAGQIRYCNTGENLGGAGGFFYGMQRVMQENYDALWLMDDDTLPEPTTLQALLDADKQLSGAYGFLAGKVLWTDGALCNMNRQKRTAFRDATDFASPLVPVAMSSFVSLFVRAETVRAFGFPLRQFFIWTDDWEYTRRLSRAMPCYLVPASVAVHAMKGNTVVNIATDSVDRLPRYACFYRNDVVLYRREGLAGWLYLLAKDLWHAAQVLLKGHGGKAQKLHTIFAGLWAGIHFHPSVEYPQQKRVLFVLSTLCQGGGVEAFCLTARKQLQARGYAVQLLILGIYEPALVQTLRNEGVRVTLLGEPIKDSFARMLRCRRQLKAYFANNPCPTVHFHTCSQSVVIPLYYARRAGVARRIVHAHSTGEYGASRLKRARYALVRRAISRLATDALACSRVAGAHMFTRKLLQSKRFAVIPNGVDLARFRFDAAKRTDMRRQLHLEDAFAVGTVGRLTPSKNQALTLSVFARVKQLRPEARLLVVGEGELREALAAQAQALGVADAVVWAGRAERVEDWLQAMDVFLFTPLFEGLGIVLIEAQATGLPCVVADTVPPEAFVTDSMARLPLQAPPETWAQAVCEAQGGGARASQTQALRQRGFSAAAMGDNLAGVYEGAAGQTEGIWKNC